MEIVLIRTRIRNWLRRVLSLPGKAAVPLGAAYLLAATFLAVRVPTSRPTQLKPWEEAAQSAAAPSPAVQPHVTGIPPVLTAEVLPAPTAEPKVQRLVWMKTDHITYAYMRQKLLVTKPESTAGQSVLQESRNATDASPVASP